MKLIMALGADHAGRELKKAVKARLEELGWAVVDFGVADEVEKADYPTVADAVAQAVEDGRCRFGTLVCGTGVGMAMAANRRRGVRAANCTSEYMARLSRAHNDANVLTLGERVVGTGLALSILEAFLAAEFEGGRHQRRVELMS
ncbi:MAG: ribose 5-phosphate isomerase B [Deltaproteobacteria bacterium]|jgi:ribose 5-phosphate isomerase B|nr:ribose 5-phosphate isomerase B [Deltaproteobacteria bacterium]